MTAPNQDSLLNITLQSYRLLEALGSGAVADVYKAQDIKTGQLYAIKVMQARWLPFPHVVPRFEAEAQLLFNLPHPQIVKGFPPLGYIDQEQTRPYFVMEYLEGGSFSDYLRGGGLLTFGQAAEFITNVCAGLHFAHRQGIVHRDLKPANILLRERNAPQSAVLTDFGIARMVYQTQMTELGNQPGTPEYMSPEQFRLQEATHLSDQYALGIIMYWMMTHRLPFRLNDPMPIGIQHLNSLPPLPSYINADVTSAIDHVVMRALAKDPHQRYADMTQLALAFSQAVYGTYIEGVPVNAMGGSRPPTGLGTYTPSTGMVRIPGPIAVRQGGGPGIPTSLVPSATAPTSPSRGSRSMVYAILGIGGLISVLLIGILGTLMSLRPDPVVTPTTVALMIVSEEATLLPSSTRRPTITRTPIPAATDTPTITPSRTKGPASTKTLTAARTPTRLSIGGSQIIVTSSSTLTSTDKASTQTATRTGQAAKTPTVTKTPTRVRTATPTNTSLPTETPTPTLTATPHITATQTPELLTLDEMLTTFNSELGTTISFNCKRFVQTYDALQNELTKSRNSYERARTLVDEADDYAVQIYQEYCRDSATDTAMKIDAMLYSRFRSETRQLMGD